MMITSAPHVSNLYSLKKKVSNLYVHTLLPHRAIREIERQEKSHI